MQLALLVALVAALAISENAPQEPVSGAPLRLTLAVAGCLLVILLAACSARAVARAIERDHAARLNWLRRFAQLKQIHLGTWLAVTGITLFLLHWPQLVRYNWGLDNAIFVKDLVILAPIWMPLTLSWTAFYEVDRALHTVLAEGRLEPAVPFASRSAYVGMHVRHYLGLGVLPALLLLAFQDTVFHLLPQWRESPHAWLICLGPLVLLTLAFPQLLSRIWKTTPLPPGPLRDRLDQLAQRMRVHCQDFRIWHTDRQVLNAAVAGILPSLRTVYMSDALLLYLRDEELESVIAHELGHVRRRHLLLRLLLLGLPLWIVGNLQTVAAPTSGWTATWPALLDSSAAANMLMAATMLAIVVMALGWYSRLLEHDADLCVYEAGYTEAFVTTIDRLACLCNDRRRRATWLHPSTASRVDLLQHALHDAQVAQRFRRRVRRVNGLLIGIWLLAPLFAAALT